MKYMLPAEAGIARFVHPPKVKKQRVYVPKNNRYVVYPKNLLKVVTKNGKPLKLVSPA